MKKKNCFYSFLVVGCLLACMPTISASAAGSLDDVVGGTPAQEQVVPSGDTGLGEIPTVGGNNTVGENGGSSNGVGLPVEPDEYAKALQPATQVDLNDPAANKINQGLKKVVSVIVQVLSYAITILLAVRCLLDLMYIALPFTRAFLANGYAGNAQAGAGQGAGAMGMQGGMGMGGMGGGFGGMGGGFGGMRGGMGMGGMGGMHGGMAGAGMQGQQPQGGRIQWVSNAALNAVSAESTVDANGRAISALKLYAKDMVVVLVLTPVLIVLALSGALTGLGAWLGGAIAKLVASLGGML